MGKLQVKVFGPTTAVLGDGTTVTDFGGARPRQILGLLAASAGTPVSKDRLAERIWEGHPPRTWSDTLESYVALLRRRLGVSSGRHSPLATRPNGYLLDPAQVDVDLDRFRHLVRATACADAPEAALVSTDEAVRLATGQLLASEPYADWAGDERCRFKTEYVVVCDRAAGAALHASRPDLAVEMARRAIGCDALSEASWQFLIRGLAETGAQSEALCAYLDLRGTMAEALGVEPNATSQALYAQLLQQDDLGSGSQSTAVDEVQSLLRLLREALSTCPDVTLSPGEQRLTAEAERLVGAAA